MSRTTRERARELEADVESMDAESVEEVRECAGTVADTAGQAGTVEATSGAEFAVLWKSVEFRCGTHMEQLTDRMLWLSAVARLTSSAGSFSLKRCYRDSGRTAGQNWVAGHAEQKGAGVLDAPDSATEDPESL